MLLSEKTTYATFGAVIVFTLPVYLLIVLEVNGGARSVDVLWSPTRGQWDLPATLKTFHKKLKRALLRMKRRPSGCP